jgi:ABC-type molybdate transport system substrate-binding protein
MAEVSWSGSCREAVVAVTSGGADAGVVYVTDSRATNGHIDSVGSRRWLRTDVREAALHQVGGAWQPECHIGPGP